MGLLGDFWTCLKTGVWQPMVTGSKIQQLAQQQWPSQSLVTCRVGRLPGIAHQRTTYQLPMPYNSLQSSNKSQQSKQQKTNLRHESDNNVHQLSTKNKGLMTSAPPSGHTLRSCLSKLSISCTVRCRPTVAKSRAISSPQTSQNSQQPRG